MFDKANFYNTISADFSNYKNDYDTNRRREVLVDEFLFNINFKGKKILDCGCADGYFIKYISKVCEEKNLSGCDISSNLVNIAKENNKKIDFFIHNIGENKTDKRFDIIISSEVIEHCENPKKALDNLCKSVSDQGYIILSTPNKLWEKIVRLASFFKLRPFQGFENFLTHKEITSVLEANKFEVINYKGIHLFPFQLGLNTIHKYLDERSEFMNKIKINYAFIAKKIK